MDGTVATQPHVDEELLDLVTSDHSGQFFEFLGADLGKHLPLRVTDHFDEKQTVGSSSLADGFGLPELLDFDVENVVEITWVWSDAQN